MLVDPDPESLQATMPRLLIAKALSKARFEKDVLNIGLEITMFSSTFDGGGLGRTRVILLI
ncbi:hypothetical protein [Denitratisoma oestradiolicum]|uniref:hypothetical protein n=1 Tax=Denitratisoma oestradiolicum TaxID=311182 RepID=UPI001E4808D1|nr:hypothetical protein [Denitratisoma oestradiolicum]